MHDLIIRNGTIVDGTGRAAFTGDIAVEGQRIVEVGCVSGTAARELNAEGLLVTPGWVDIHTHYDGQASWGGGSCARAVSELACGCHDGGDGQLRRGVCAGQAGRAIINS